MKYAAENNLKYYVTGHLNGKSQNRRLYSDKKITEKPFEIEYLKAKDMTHTET